ncbi:nucleoside diphosphate kinase homolog 5-like [Anoplophora glabripennis]|uniref:nucleoside diphosphate kinase homolog 5-like n=1 Tax=Anoplophora glabripennis TaxID=217634 RepID=UPI000874643A|nr:nucleoside diphosphate kinase homolog 5-like [Anoplophora glabripennis]
MFAKRDIGHVLISDDFNLQDTVHYLSPATSNTARTEYEGDFLYDQFVEFRATLPPPSPDYESTVSSTISCVEPELQRTLAIIKPEAIKYKDVVLRAINESGLKIINKRIIHLSPEQVSEIYAQHYGSPAFPHIVVSMSVSPLLVLSLAGINAVEKWKTMTGPFGSIREEWFFPYSVRTRFGIQDDQPDTLHSSENVSEAKTEIRYFYPTSILEPLISDEDKATDYIVNYIKPTLLDGLTQLVRVKPLDPIIFLAEWLLLNNPFQPRFPERIALNPL